MAGVEAPGTAAAGEPVEVRVTANVGKHMYIGIVPSGSPDSIYGDPRGAVETTTDITSRISKLPKEPGDYEIRCSSK